MPCTPHHSLVSQLSSFADTEGQSLSIFASRNLPAITTRIWMQMPCGKSGPRGCQRYKQNKHDMQKQHALSLTFVQIVYNTHISIELCCQLSWSVAVNLAVVSVFVSVQKSARRCTSHNRNATVALQSSWKTISVTVKFVFDDNDNDYFNQLRPRL